MTFRTMTAALFALAGLPALAAEPLAGNRYVPSDQLPWHAESPGHCAW